ncbi:MAG TPA: ABC transporter substrate-binding protein [Gammaproteobacteria bacterium]|nr:ABC transporter substrate-binding protein [Gammaproteobacteria bacterium]
MKRLLFLLASFFICAGAGAADVAPDLLVKNVTNEVLDLVRQDKDIRSGNTQKTLDLVEAKVLPHFNFVRMTQLALGREGRQASPEQLNVLVNEFRNLLVRTYSKALTEYRDQKISFKPFSMDAADTDVKVRSEIKQSGGKPISLDYYLEKIPAGWKVYDVEVGGVSLVTNYRTAFSQEIRANGIDGLIRSLQAKNKTTEPAAKAK